jgi:hypothetical protein
MAIELTDDGTMDTVLRCSECGEEFRFNYANSGADEANAETELSDADHEAHYDEWVQSCIEDAEADHACDDETRGPQEDDITTADHEKFYQSGKLAFSIVNNGADRFSGFDAKGICFAQFLGSVEAIVRAFNDREQFWPNCWFISDHGNAHLMDLTEGK